MKPSVRDENKNLIKGLCKPVVNDVCFFFNDTATTEIYTLSLHDALPILTDALLVRPIEANTQSGFIYTQSEFYEEEAQPQTKDRKSTRLNSSHANISYAVFCLKKTKQHTMCRSRTFARPRCARGLESKPG